MDKGFTFNFFDHNRDTNIRYLATYTTGLKIDITCERIEPGKGMQIPHVEKRGEASDPWGIFYEHATFESILRGLTLYAVKTRQGTQNEPDDLYFRFLKTVPDNSTGREIPVIAIDHAAFLRSIAENPDRLLYNDETLRRFVMLLWAAKTGVIPPYMKETREDIKKMFIQNLVPKHRGGKKGLPQGTEAARELLKILADHTTTKCKKVLDTLGTDYSTESALDETWKDDYDSLMNWGSIHEPRIVILSTKELKYLILHPRDYADAILENAVSASLSTLNRSVK
ncbi:MAG: hypothetical protein C0392_05810 [Syntrophus sp. (in: bacteria)]|nr:hypothetical protein [Syntrophus sp. (in: bacteria)]